ncbi:glycoside hydrolase family 16 protein [Reichenbachiella sp.]|uniref:glycoside hydrolase family 16 protein n=1 Tax=Reichenbachiella sp. TaxID=2184521 RepID=UPI003B5BE072
MNIIIKLTVLLFVSTISLAQSGYKLVWFDEFDYSGLPDVSKWSYDVGDGCPNVCGWGNNELEYYTEERLENARVEDGHLIITAIKENMGSKAYSSARLVTREKGDWTYGRIEVKAMLPSGVGTWPAIWMLSTDWSYGGWPESGEIDIMEHVGYESNKIYGTVHTKAYHHSIGTQKGGEIIIEDCEEDFHV